jgi:hypothetical protein
MRQGSSDFSSWPLLLPPVWVLGNGVSETNLAPLWPTFPQLLNHHISCYLQPADDFQKGGSMAERWCLLLHKCAPSTRKSSIMFLIAQGLGGSSFRN